MRYISATKNRRAIERTYLRHAAQSMKMDKYTIVLCLKGQTHREDADSVDRFIRIGLASYKKFMKLEDVHEIIVITPAKERASIDGRLRTAGPEFPWTVLGENELVDSSLTTGWAKQQTAKMAISKRIKTAIYLIIDDDTFAVRPFGIAQLMHGGRAKMNKTPIDFPFFFLWSAEVLGADFEGLVQPQPFHMAITPEIFVTEVVKNLIKTLEARHGAYPEWQKAIVNNKYTEYCVYWTHLLTLKKTDALYATSPDAPALYAAATTGADHDLASQLREAFAPEGTHIFSFVQTSLPHTTDEILRHITEW